MRKQHEQSSLSSAQLPARTKSSAGWNTDGLAVQALKDWQASWAQNAEQCRKENRPEDAEFGYKISRLAGILAEMVNAEARFNERQQFWVSEMLTALPGEVTAQDALWGNKAALALVGLAQYINSCRQ